MNLPQRRDSPAVELDAKPGIRPRPIQKHEGISDEPEIEGVLHFSCPACLRMISAARGAALLVCGFCEAQVIPPRVAEGREPRGHLSAPTKTGRLK